MTSKQTSLTIAGLEVNIYSSSASDDEKPVVIFFLLHGRLESTEVADPIARAMIEQAQTIRRERELLVITFVSKIAVALSQSSSDYLYLGPTQPREASHQSHSEPRMGPQ